MFEEKYFDIWTIPKVSLRRKQSAFLHSIRHTSGLCMKYVISRLQAEADIVGGLELAIFDLLADFVRHPKTGSAEFIAGLVEPRR